MARAAAMLRRVLCGAALLNAAGPVLAERSGGLLEGLFGGYSGGRSSHDCHFDRSPAETHASLGSVGIKRFLAAKARHRAEICGAAVPSSYCDCRPAWQCPLLVSGQQARSCQLPGHRLGYCCPQRDDATSTAISSTTTSVPAVSTVTVTVTSLIPSPVTVTAVTTTTYAFSHATTAPSYTPATQSHYSTTTSRPDSCRALVLCPTAVVGPSRLVTCRLRDGALGVLCEDPTPADPAGQPEAAAVGADSGAQLSSARPLSAVGDKRRPFSSDRVVSEQFVTAAAGGGDASRAEAEATLAVQAQIERDATLTAPSRDSPVGIFNLNFQSDPEEQQLGMLGLQQLLTIGALEQQTDANESVVNLVSAAAPVAGSASDAGGGFSGFDTRIIDSELAPAAPRPLRIPGCTPEPQPLCEPSPYRTANGACNNLQRPRQGCARSGFKRLLKNTYEDGLFAIRNTSVTGRSLPSPRLISERVVETISRELSGFTLSVMQWGQFIDHDLTHALIFRLADGNPIECCENGGRTLPSSPLHQQCIPIEIPADDPFYSQFGQRCMSLVRSLPAPEPDCIARPATPINELTAYLDASNVYGNNAATQRQLRAFSGGLLRTSAGHLLPIAPPDGADCVPAAKVCFLAGDSRVNEQSALTVMHTVFTREHNRVATALRRRHGDWDDERLFQEARRVVIAEWQHIVYNEWLPIVVGFDYARDHDLLPLQNGFSTRYDPAVDATVSNEFATAAFRFGHSMTRDMYDLINAYGAITHTVPLTRTFFNPTVVADGLVEHARTLVARRSETFDRNVISSVHEQLFTSNFRFGLDLIALNIQRGRDHGIPTYTSVLHACNDVNVTRWSDLDRLMDSSAIDQLRAVYADPRDVDLFIGGLSERRARGAQVGPTFQCLIGQQFFDVRYGDRFFYDNGGFEHSFSAAQLAEIRKSSWSRIMCDTLGPEFGGDFGLVQPLAFLESTAVPNFVVKCNSLAIPKVDLSVF